MRYNLSLDESELKFIIKLFDFYDRNHKIIKESEEEELFRDILFMMDAILIEIEENQKEIEIRKNQIEKLKSLRDEYKYYLYHDNDLYDQNNKNDFIDEISIEIKKSEKLLKNLEIIENHKNLNYKESDFQIEYSEDDRRKNKDDRRIDWESEKNLKL